MTGESFAGARLENEVAVVPDWRMTRRRFLGLSVATAVGVGTAHLFLNAAGPGRATLTWLSPRGSLAVVDDYPLWVARHLGYMDRQGIDLSIDANTAEPLVPRKKVAGAAITLPSPASLVSDSDRGLPTTAIFQLCAASVFGFALPAGNGHRTASDLTGASIAVGDESWRQIVDPLLAEASVDPKSITLVVAGDRWLSLVSSGRADAALTWRGLEPAADGRGLRHLVGDRWSQLPANAYAVDGPEGLGGAHVDALTRFLKATVMGLEFAQLNPRAAAQITYRSAPDLAPRMSPRAAVDALRVTAGIYSAGRRRGLPWGYHEPARWERYAIAAQRAGLVKSIEPKEIYTNQLIPAANSVDLVRVNVDANMFALDREFSAVANPTGG